MQLSLAVPTRVITPLFALLLTMAFMATPKASSALGPSNCTECMYGCGAGSTGHTAPITEGGSLASVHSFCIDIGEQCAHPPCASALQTVDLQNALILAGGNGRLDLTSARSLLDKYPDALEYNATRGALQIVGCAPGTVIAHIPLSDAAADALAAEATSSTFEAAHS
jgi:hypothetical protein